jgi:hypothetical protein
MLKVIEFNVCKLLLCTCANVVARRVVWTWKRQVMFVTKYIHPSHHKSWNIFETFVYNKVRVIFIFSVNNLFITYKYQVLIHGWNSSMFMHFHPKLIKFIYECSFFIHNVWNTFMTISYSFVTNLQIIQEYAFVICFNGKGFGEIYIQWIKSSSHQFQRFAFWYVRFVYITWTSQLYYKQNLPWAKLWWQQMDNRPTRSSLTRFNPNGSMLCNQLWLLNYIKYYLGITTSTKMWCKCDNGCERWRKGNSQL